MSRYVLPRKRPEDEGVNPTNILSFINSIEENHIELHGFTVVRHGNVVAEGFWKPYRKELPHMLFSLSKSFTAMAVGFAVCEGLISVGDPVVSFFPDDLPEGMDPKFRSLIVQHLLCMATGHKEDFLEKVVYSGNRDWARRFFEFPLEYEPGTHFVYNNMATYMLSVIVTKVTGQPVLEYLTPRLFNKLGIEKPFWGTDYYGNNLGAWGLNLKNEDIARFGLMLLNKGMFYGERVIPEAWVEEATTRKISNGDNPESDWNQGYGYQFWMCRHNAFRGDGAFGQYCIVLPEKDAVIAINSGVSDMQIVMDLVFSHLLPGMGDKSLAQCEDHAKLVEKCENLHYDPATEVRCIIGSPFIGSKYALENNQFGLKELSVSVDKDILRMTIKGPQGVDLKAGMNGWLEAASKLPNDMLLHRRTYRTAASYSWEDENTLLLDVCYIETPFRFKLRCVFNGDNVELHIAQNVSMKPEEAIKIIGSRVKQD